MTSLEASQPSSRAYRTLGRYRVYSELASGGMATVHLGCMLGPAGFSKLVAIKCLHARFALENEFVAMFLDEARLTSSIHHPNVVASLDVVAEQGELLVVMEYIHGESLAALLRTSRQTGDAPPLPVVTRILCDALEGLHAAHSASLAGRCLNIVHRDVSPQNIMVGADGNTRVLDFGIAQAAMRSRVSESGNIKGKIAYMSPEQAQNQAVDARTDIFAAGVVLWEALTGKRLFFAADPRESLALLLTSEVAPPSAIVPSLSSEVDRVVMKALARDPERRFDSAHDFAEALRRAASEGSRRAVSDWVGRVAKDSLARRLHLLETLEASAIHAQADAEFPLLTGSSPFDVAIPAGEGIGTEASRTQAPGPDAASTRPVAVGRQRSLIARWAPMAAALFGSAMVLVAWTLTAKHPSAQSTVPAAATTVLARAPVDAAAEPSALATVSRSIAAAPMPPATSTAERAKRAPSKPRAVARAGEQSAKGQACTPPYRIDASGVRRVKLECL